MLAPMEPPPPHPALLQRPRNPAGAIWDFQFFVPLEADFEKVVFKKVIALAMLYLVVFENSKKVNFQAFYGNFRSVGAQNDSVGAQIFFKIKF